ncbi:hypothetical protein OOU_Y34scaffold00697g43 [Pyricularia oryzae Y34]|uniref:Uncharacterized protein n=2 Tax=Pyricularia oryzae TaxID=318829 RepID=A0AA97PIA9_PYRO3|nr:hypothetical protein OOU_Y34scaffold00697g43 [Pyricularia oryzae Y34]
MEKDGESQQQHPPSEGSPTS